MKLLPKLFNKKQSKYPPKGSLVFYRPELIWYAYLSYNDENLEDIPIGVDLFIDRCRDECNLIVEYFPYKRPRAIGFHFDIDRPAKKDPWLEFVLDNSDPNEPAYIVTGHLAEETGHYGHRLHICECMELLYHGCPQTLTVHWINQG